MIVNSKSLLYKLRARRLVLLFLLVAACLGGSFERAGASQSLELTWNPSPNPDIVAYNVYFGTESGHYSGSITFANVSDVIIPGFEGGTTYYFAVSATSTNAEESSLSNEAFYAVPMPAPLALQAQEVSTGSQAVELTWNPSPENDIFGYNVYYGTESGVYTNAAVFYGTTNGVVTGLDGGATYFFAVAAIDAHGVQPVLSNEAAFAVPGPAPIMLQTQILTDASGQPFALHINTAVALSGFWEMDRSPDLQHWFPFAYGYGYGYGDGSDVDAYAWINSDEPQMFFRLVTVTY